MKQQPLVAIACGVVPMLVIVFAYWLNIHAGDDLAPIFHCNPFFEGCVSTSRAVRSGPGLIWFKVVMLPCVLLMVLTWRSMGGWMAGLGDQLPAVRRWAMRLGIVGAVALVAYVIWLGTEGMVYSWLRRYGVVFFFGFTALAQLLSARFVWDVFRAHMPWRAAFFITVVFAQWVIGVFSVAKRFFFDDAVVVDRIENITEWLMLAAMSLGFVLIGLLFSAQANRSRF
jgi:hypothetical protein